MAGMIKAIRYCIVPILLALAVQEVDAAALEAGTARVWEKYVALTEARISRDLDSPSRFMTIASGKTRDRLKNGEVHIERGRITVTEGAEMRLGNGMIHHWSGAIFVPGVSLEALLNWLQDYDDQHRYFKEVEQSQLVARDGNTFQIFLRLARTKIVTVHYNTNHTVVYRRHGPRRASSWSVATRIAELKDTGTASERELPAGNDRGFLWRLNSYWKFSEEDGGVVVECESISLSRSVPFGLGWLIDRYVESIPRESLRDTLIQIREGVRRRRIL